MMDVLKNENTTVYETYFSRPEVMAMYIVDFCPIDCYECMMPENIPCYREFGITTDTAEKYYSEILEWLNSPKESKWWDRSKQS